MQPVKKQFADLKPALVTAVLILILMALFSLWAAQQLPADAKMPVHWNVNGQPDRYAGKFQGLFMMPLVVLLMTLLMAFIPRIEPRKKHIQMSMKVYNLILTGIVLVFAAMHIVVVMTALGKTLSVEKIVPTLLGALFLVIGNYMGKIRSNYMLGIKTPWTLTSELSWNKTHRLSGRLFILAGFLIFLSSLLCPGKITMLVLLCSIVGTVIISIAYSYFIWQKDPDKQPK